MAVWNYKETKILNRLKIDYSRITYGFLMEKDPFTCETSGVILTFKHPLTVLQLHVGA